MNILWISFLLLMTAVPDQDAPKKYDLSFDPDHGDIAVVRVEKDNQWEYEDKDMKGTMRTELTLRWRLTPQAEAKGFMGKADFVRVVYRGQGVKMGKEFHHDVEWTAKDKYLRGQGSDADKQWVAEELAEGITLKFDHRGACEPGRC